MQICALSEHTPLSKRSEGLKAAFDILIEIILNHMCESVTGKEKRSVITQLCSSKEILIVKKQK